MLDRENVAELRIIGEQHERFGDTLPSMLNEPTPSNSENP